MFRSSRGKTCLKGTTTESEARNVGLDVWVSPEIMLGEVSEAPFNFSDPRHACKNAFSLQLWSLQHFRGSFTSLHSTPPCFGRDTGNSRAGSLSGGEPSTVACLGWSRPTSAAGVRRRPRCSSPPTSLRSISCSPCHKFSPIPLRDFSTCHPCHQSAHEFHARCFPHFMQDVSWLLEKCATS